MPPQKCFLPFLRKEGDQGQETAGAGMALARGPELSLSGGDRGQFQGRICFQKGQERIFPGSPGHKAQLFAAGPGRWRRIPPSPGKSGSASLSPALLEMPLRVC